MWIKEFGTNKTILDKITAMRTMGYSCGMTVHTSQCPIAYIIVSNRNTGKKDAAPDIGVFSCRVVVIFEG